MRFLQKFITQCQGEIGAIGGTFDHLVRLLRGEQERTMRPVRVRCRQRFPMRKQR